MLVFMPCYVPVDLERAFHSALLRRPQKEQLGGPHTLTMEAPELQNPSLIARDGDPLLSAAGEGLGGGETSRFQYQSSTRVVIFPVMFVGVQLKFVFLAERQEGQFGTHTTHMSSTMTWPCAWHWLPDS